MRRVLLWSVGALAALLVISGAQAAIVTLPGDDVEFTFDDSTAFGSGLVIGNSIFFLPTTFKAESTDGSPATDTMNVTLNVTVEATTAGYEMTDFMMAEEGDYKLIGSGSSVSANGQFRITSSTTLCGFFTCRDDMIFDAGPLTSL